jgi:hypothetical protein
MKQHTFVQTLVAICILAAVGCRREPYARTQIDYVDALFSPEGDWIYFVMRRADMRESHDPAYPDDPAYRVGVIQNDQVWLKRVRLSDNHVESLQGWTPGSVGQRYATFKSRGVSAKAKLVWKTGRELAYQINLETDRPSSGWHGTLSGVWNSETGKIGDLNARFVFPPDTSASRLHDQQEAIIAGMIDGPKTILVYDRSVPKATSYAVSPPATFKPYGGVSLLNLAIHASRREQIEARSRGLTATARGTVPRIEAVARALTPGQVTHLRSDGELTSVDTGKEKRYAAEVRLLFQKAIATPGKIAEVEIPPNAPFFPWVPEVLYMRDGDRYFELRKIE